MAFITRIQPEATIWYHQQPTPLVGESGGENIALEQRYANLVSLPLTQLTRYPGSGIGWENHTLPGTTGFRRRLKAGTTSSTTIQQHANAVLTLLG